MLSSPAGFKGWHSQHGILRTHTWAKFPEDIIAAKVGAVFCDLVIQYLSGFP
jgi:hypothetical protein